MQWEEDNKNIKYSEIFSVLKEKPALFHLIIMYYVIFLLIVTIKPPAYIPYCFNILKMRPVIYGVYGGFISFLYVIVSLSIHKFIKSDKTKNYTLSYIPHEGLLTIFIAAIPLIIFNNQVLLVTYISLTAISSFPVSFELTSFSTIFQKSVSVNILGRFYSVRSIFRGIINVLSPLSAGYITDIIEPLPVIMFSGIILLIVVIPTKNLLDNFPQ